MSGETNKTRNSTLLSISLLILVVFLVSAFYKPNNIVFSPYQAPEPEDSSIKVLVTGDMMLDRNVRRIINTIGFGEFFSGIRTLVQDADIAIVNLEGPFTTFPSVTADLKSKELVFTFDPALSPALAELGFDVMGLANNHTYNFGKVGLEQTRRYIGSSGMLYYGDPFNKDEISTVIIKNNIRIGLVGFHEFYYTGFENVLFEIARLREEVDVLIVTPHWGIEYQKEPTPKMVEWAHQFIHNGADVVIGAHPHIVGDIEGYQGKKIYYSLGNFVFDQYFSKATMEGLAVEMEIEKGKNGIVITYKDIPTVIDRKGVRLSTEL